MFSDTLSERILSILRSRRLSYETAAELCGISSRCLGGIVRREVEPKLPTVEKLCRGFGTTPDELLLPEMPHRLEPMRVTAFRTLRSGDTYYPVCPGCHVTLEREYQRYCDRCGQRLDWSAPNAAIILSDMD